MKLILQPDDGLETTIEALNQAAESIQIAIFRCDLASVQKALIQAVKRGVAVRALIASTNRGGETRLRGLETRLLAAGAVVARTDNDLARYHGKYFIVDGKELYVLGYNFTRCDINGTRSFGIEIEDPAVVKAAAKLFECDSTRQKFDLDNRSLIVSPINARERLVKFIEGASQELLIYDLNVSDPQMTAVLRSQANAGVKVQILGHMKDRPEEIAVRTPSPLRLHARTIVRDRKWLFVGSQSLRRLELDKRREVGVIVEDTRCAKRVAATFEEDWETATKTEVPAAKIARRVAKTFTKELGPVAELVEKVAAKNGATVDTEPEDVEKLVKEAVKNAVRDAVEEVVSSQS